MTLDLARWQFAITTVYHFLFVPLTIGLSLLVAGMQTVWVRTGDAPWLRMTKFWGKLLLINFAMGVVTGIVQEFQFGMNWSSYSRFVGDIFGAPLAIEGLLAFFLESTFLGLWIFGWDRLAEEGAPGLHLAGRRSARCSRRTSSSPRTPGCSTRSATVVNTARGPRRAHRLRRRAHQLHGGRRLRAHDHRRLRHRRACSSSASAPGTWRRERDARCSGRRCGSALVTVLIASIGVVVTGDLQARLMTEQQPMKMAAAEALWDTTAPASFSLFTIGSLDGSKEVWSVRVPGVLSFMATGSFDGTVEGINDLQQRPSQQFGPGDYMPVIPMTYWTFRLMIGFGLLAALSRCSACGSCRAPLDRACPAGSGSAPSPASRLPFLANSVGWIFTEMGRQPWVGLRGAAHRRRGLAPPSAPPPC